MECSATGKENCSCTYKSCARRGNCCQCIAYHKNKDQFTACFFTPEAERTYDRSLQMLLKDRGV